MTSRVARVLILLTIVVTGLAACVTERPQAPPKIPSWTDHDRVRTDRLHDSVTEIRVMLEDYYGGSTVLDHSWYLPLEHPSHTPGIEFLAAKFARTIVWQEPLVIGTIGSSVLAGHDNCRFGCWRGVSTRWRTTNTAGGAALGQQMCPDPGPV